MDRTVVVSGANGLLGSALSERLRAGGDRVVALHRSSSPVEGAVAVDVAARWVDIQALQALGPIDAVVHLAGAGIADRRWSDVRKREILESRTEMTSLLAGTFAQLERPPASFLSGSAIGYYGDTGTTAVDEHGEAGRDFLAQVCVEWEAAALESPTRTVLLRTGIVLAKQGGALKKQLPLFRAGLGGRLGTGRQYLSWIGLSDWLRAVEFLLDHHEVAGPVNLTAPNPTTNAEFTKALASALHRPAIAPVPPLALRLALGSELATTALLASQRVVPSALEAAGFTFANPTLDDTLRAELAA